jgi:hypothetical protein
MSTHRNANIHYTHPCIHAFLTYSTCMHVLMVEIIIKTSESHARKHEKTHAKSGAMLTARVCSWVWIEAYDFYFILGEKGFPERIMSFMSFSLSSACCLSWRRVNQHGGS